VKLSNLRDLVALVLAGGAAVALVVIAVGASVHRGPISQEESSLLSTALGAAVGAIATYLGLAGREHSPTPAPAPVAAEAAKPEETVRKIT
jgi:hypothetical protein